MSAEQDDEQPVLTAVHRSLIRPDLPFGCERGPLVFLFAIAMIFLIILIKPLTAIAAVVLLAGGIPALRYLAARDPNWYRVWTRHNYYRPHEFQVHAGVATPVPIIRDQQRQKGHTA